MFSPQNEKNHRSLDSFYQFTYKDWIFICTITQMHDLLAAHLISIIILGGNSELKKKDIFFVFLPLKVEISSLFWCKLKQIWISNNSLSPVLFRIRLGWRYSLRGVKRHEISWRIDFFLLNCLYMILIGLAPKVVKHLAYTCPTALWPACVDIGVCIRTMGVMVWL